MYAIKDDKPFEIFFADNPGWNLILNKFQIHIFQPYFSHLKHGTGIGLYMFLTIIESKFGGKIEVKNSEDGAIFKVTLRLYSSYKLSDKG